MQKRSAIAVLLSLFAGFSCKTTTSEPAADDLRRAVNDSRVESYIVSLQDDGDRLSVALTNPAAVRDFVRLDAEDTKLLVRYLRVADRKTGTDAIHKTEVVKSGSNLELLVTNHATGEIVDSSDFPAPEAVGAPASGFVSIAACQQQFNCEHGSAIQCEADRTCRDQFVGTICPLADGTLVSVHWIVHPTGRDFFNCLKAPVLDLMGLVMKRD